MMKDCFLTKPSYLKQQQKEILRLTGQVNNMWKKCALTSRLLKCENSDFKHG